MKKPNKSQRFINLERLNAYRIMWLFVLFDLPAVTDEEKKVHAGFRKKLVKDGFSMFQFSIYVRHCPSMENASVHIKRVKAGLPEIGHVTIMRITDKQFGDMETYSGIKQKAPPVQPVIQLQMF